MSFEFDFLSADWSRQTPFVFRHRTPIVCHYWTPIVSVAILAVVIGVSVVMIWNERSRVKPAREVSVEIASEVSVELASEMSVRIWVLRVNNPVRYSSTSSRHATVLL